jgi:hypothetical protein
VGPCVHEYREPVLNIVSAASSNGTPIGHLTLTNVQVNGHAPGPGAFQDAVNAVLTNGKIECDVPCGFGTEEGLWQFTAEAEGYQPEEIAVETEYAVFVGGCPSYNDAGTELAIELDPV